jgi:hypothetical protein
MFTFPDGGPGGESYYAVSFGDVFLISMNVSRIARSWSVSGKSRGKFMEALSKTGSPEAWGFGEFLFERFDSDSRQLHWLENILTSKAFKHSKYQVVIAHQSVFGLGNNAVPVLAEPEIQIVKTGKNGKNGDESITRFTFPISASHWNNEVLPQLKRATEIRYEYPLDKDIWLNDVEPLLVKHGVDLVQSGHSHLWNRAKVGDMNYLETSNVGNSYGAYFMDDTGEYTNDLRASYASFWEDLNSAEPRWNAKNYPPNGDPHGRGTALPSVFSPMSMVNAAYPTLPFVASDQLSVFSIMDTGAGTIKSYVFDPNDLSSKARLFDQFEIDK